MLNENKQLIQKDVQVQLKLVGTRNKVSDMVSGSTLLIFVVIVGMNARYTLIWFFFFSFYRVDLYLQMLCATLFLGTVKQQKHVVNISIIFKMSKIIIQVKNPS
jgi:hypothetical protein